MKCTKTKTTLQHSFISTQCQSLLSLNKKTRRHRETHLQSDRRVVLGGVSTHQAFLFTFLEFPKVVLYQEGGIELPHGYLII